MLEIEWLDVNEAIVNRRGEAMLYAVGWTLPNYPMPALRRDVCYWNCGGISINTVGQCEASYIFGKAFGNGIRLNYWEP